jgi:hypothetical protein
MRRLTATLLLLTITLAATADDLPKLAIVSRLGAGPMAKVFNREPVSFFAVTKGKEKLLRGVSFKLYDRDGDPAAEEDVRARWKAEQRWGAPPACAELPLEDRSLPVGRYRLRAEKPGFAPAEIDVVVARLRYFGLAAEHQEKLYRANFRIRLQDPTETRKAVKATVRIHDQAGAILDQTVATLLPVQHRPFVFESGTVKLSSTRKTPNRDQPATMRKGILKLVSGCKLSITLDGIRFDYAVPLRPENRQLDAEQEPEEPEEREEGELEDASDRDVRYPPRKPRPRAPGFR